MRHKRPFSHANAPTFATIIGTIDRLVTSVRSRCAPSLVALVSLAFPLLGLAAEPEYPLAVATSDESVIFLADRNLPGIWKLDGDNLSVYFQAAKKFRTPLNAVRCVAFDHQGKLLAGDSATRDVYRFDDAGQPVALTKGAIGIPMSIAVTKAGDLYVADLEVHVIWKVPAAGGEPTKFAEVPAPRGLALDAEERLWVVSHGKDQLLRLDASGKSEPVVKGRPFQFPHQVALDADQNAYVTDGYAKAVWKVTLGAEPKKVVEGEPLVNPVGIARRGANFLIVDPRAKALFQLDASGKLDRLPMKTQ